MTTPGDTFPADSKGRERVLRFQSLAEGALFANRYEIRGPIGSGGAGEVFEAFDRVAQSTVALKVLFPGIGARDVERLRRELRVVRSLQNPGILRVYDIGEADGLFYIVSELLEGESLAERLRRRGRLPAAEAEGIVRDVLDALRHAHLLGVVHRDVKPGNIFLGRRRDDSRERAILLDFGLARETDVPGVTVTGRFVGTPVYCSPEQARGDRQLGPASDLYGLGVTLWEMLAGTPPYGGTSDVAVLNAHLSHPLPTMSAAIHAAPSRLRALLVRLLEKDPEKRPASAAAAAAELEGNHLLAAVRVFVARLAALLGRRGRLRIAAVAIVALAAMTIAVLWLATPVAVEADGDRIVWVTRSGLRVRSAAFDGAVKNPILVGEGRGVNPYVLVPRTPPFAAEGSPRAGTDEIPLEIDRVAWLGGRRSSFLSASHREYLEGQASYPSQTPTYNAGVVTYIPPEISGGSESIAIEITHRLEYPARVISIGGLSDGFYDHPGHTDYRAILPPTSRHPGLLVVWAWNNLLGPRGAIFALPLRDEFGGQAPPYTVTGRRPDSAWYYLPLPYSRRGNFGFRVEGDSGMVRLAGGSEFRFDAGRGIPLDPEDRGGLDPDAWDRRRKEVFEALYKAQGEAQLGRYREAARTLRAAAAVETGGSPLNAIAWYWTAIFESKAAQEGDRAAGESALDAIDRALALEPEAARMFLLKAESEIRLGRQAAAAQTLRAFWTNAPETYRYEWMLLCWLAGTPLPLDAALGEFDKRGHAWTPQIRLAHAVLFGDPRDARVMERPVNPNFPHRDEFDYWVARAWLAGDDPDPAKALDWIDSGRKACLGGLVIPWLALEVHAKRKLDPQRVTTRAEAVALERERQAVRGWSYRGTEAMVFERLAEGDLGLEGREPRKPTAGNDTPGSPDSPSRPASR